MKYKSLGKYLIAGGYYISIGGGVPTHKDKKHCVRTMKILEPYIGKKIEFFIKASRVKIATRCAGVGQ